MDIEINAEVKYFDRVLTMAELFATLGLAGKGIAVARNGEVIPHSVYKDVYLQAGDKIDIVHAIGGG